VIQTRGFAGTVKAAVELGTDALLFSFIFLTGRVSLSYPYDDGFGTCGRLAWWCQIDLLRSRRSCRHIPLHVSSHSPPSPGAASTISLLYLRYTLMASPPQRWLSLRCPVASSLIVGNLALLAKADTWSPGDESPSSEFPLLSLLPWVPAIIHPSAHLVLLMTYLCLMTITRSHRHDAGPCLNRSQFKLRITPWSKEKLACRSFPSRMSPF
jgi:hypothetical protein